MMSSDAIVEKYSSFLISGVTYPNSNLQDPTQRFSQHSLKRT